MHQSWILLLLGFYQHLRLGTLPNPHPAAGLASILTNPFQKQDKELNEEVLRMLSFLKAHTHGHFYWLEDAFLMLIPFMMYDCAPDSTVCGACSLCPWRLSKPLKAIPVYLHCDSRPSWKMCVCVWGGLCVLAHTGRFSYPLQCGTGAPTTSFMQFRDLLSPQKPQNKHCARSPW